MTTLSRITQATEKRIREDYYTTFSLNVTKCLIVMQDVFDNQFHSLQSLASKAFLRCKFDDMKKKLKEHADAYDVEIKQIEKNYQDVIQIFTSTTDSATPEEPFIPVKRRLEEQRNERINVLNTKYPSSNNEFICFVKREIYVSP